MSAMGGAVKIPEEDCKLMLDYGETAWYNFNLRGYSANFAMQM